MTEEAANLKEPALTGGGFHGWCGTAKPAGRYDETIRDEGVLEFLGILIRLGGRAAASSPPIGGFFFRRNRRE